MYQKSKKFRSINIVSGLLFILMFVASAWAQQSKLVESGIVSGVPYASTNFENINLTNGGLNITFPLAGLQGRGGAGFTYTLRYNSKLWQSVNSPVDGQSGTTYQDLLGATEDAGGWGEVDTYQLKIINRLEGADNPVGNTCQTATSWRLAYRWKLEMRFPSGGKVEFRPTGYKDIPSGGNPDDGGYFNIHPDGSVLSVVNQNGSCVVNSTPKTHNSMTYYSSDGSGMRLTTQWEGAPGNEVMTWELSMPDGSRVVKMTDRQRIYDKNNNFVETAAVTLPDSTQTTGWVDEFGRYIAKKTTAPGEVSYYQTGYNGEMLVWKVNWKTIYVQKTYTTSCNSCPPEQRGEVIDVSLNNEDFSVVESIELPQQLGGLIYTFDYYAKDQSDSNDSTGWGELKSVTMPTQALVTYDYEILNFTPVGIYYKTNQVMERSGRIVEKKLNYTETYDGQSTPREDVWLYSTGRSGGTVTAPNGGVSSEHCWDSVYDAQKGGQVFKSVKPNGTIIETVWANNLPTGFDYGSGNRLNAYIKSEIITVPDSSGNPALITARDYTLDANGNQTEVAEYDYMTYSPTAIPRDSYGKAVGIPSGLPVKRKTVTDYYNSASASSSNAYWNATASKLRNLVKSSEVRNGGGTPFSRTEIDYDYTTYTTNTIGGNPTQTRAWDSTKGIYSSSLTTGTGGNAISTSVIYDSHGLPILMTDAKGNQTQITYGDVTTPTGTVSGLYPTQTVTAYGTSIAQTAIAEYDFYTGLVKQTTVLGNKSSEDVTTAIEYDALGRPTKVKAAVGTASEVWTQTEYNDVLRRIIVKSDVETIGDARKAAIRHFDQLGRVRLSRVLENAATEDAANEQQGIKVQTRYKYHNGADPANSNGAFTLTSNPYRAATSGAASGEESMGWTLGYADKTGRTSIVETFAGAGLPAAFGGSNTNSSGVVTTNADSQYTTVTDQAGKQRRSVTNALGQLIRVDEPDANGNLGSPTSPAQATFYGYNTLGKMIEVTQGAQKRHFLYDSLGRLMRVRQPEQTVNSALSLSAPETTNTHWTAGFTYDNNGNVLTATDAKGVTITNAYDALNRVTTRSYSDAITPPVTYTYDDQNVPYSKGKLTKVGSTISETKYTEYDMMGRLLASEQRTPFGTETAAQATPRVSEYTYNLSGVMTEQKYPSGRVVKNFLEADGDLAAISSKVMNGQFKNYASNFAYTATGVIKHLQIGNGLWESAKLNSRNQVMELNMGNSPTDGSLWKLNYEYGEFDANGNVDATRNAGNIAKQTISFNGLSQPFVQTYKYDSLDRITEAKETNNGNQTWMQTFGYDKYGNRNAFYQNVGGNVLQIDNHSLPQVDPNTNRIQIGQGYNYDAGGNLIQDADGTQFTFNGDNKQIEVKNSQNQTIGQYFYDGNGKRVKKVTPSETTIFVYDGAGKLVAEYSTATPPQNPTTNYTATDPLGSPRVITNKQGEIVSRRDFMPFGEQLAPDASYRTTNLKYNYGDNIRQKFTGYQRDEETGLDFAEARYYNNKHGRFTAVDPLLASGKSADPQTFNRYAYTMNRPLILTDSTGLQAAAEKKSVTVEASEVTPTVKPVASSYDTTLKGTDTKVRVFYSDDVVNKLNDLATQVETLTVAQRENAKAAAEHGAAAINQADASSIANEVVCFIINPALGLYASHNGVSPEDVAEDYTDSTGQLNIPGISNGIQGGGGIAPQGIGGTVTTGTTENFSSGYATAMFQTAANTQLLAIDKLTTDGASERFAEQNQGHPNVLYREIGPDGNLVGPYVTPSNSKEILKETYNITVKAAQNAAETNPFRR